MGRGRMGNSGGGTGRGSSSFGGGGRSYGGHSHTTVFVGSHGYHRYHNGGPASPFILLIVGAVFVLVGIGVFFGGFSQLFKYNTVDAVCVLNEESHSYYYSTYVYTIDGKEYRNRSEQSWEFPADENVTIEIYYERNNPNKIYEERPTDTGESVMIIIGGLIFASIGSIPVILGIMQIKKGKAGDKLDGASGNVPEVTHVTCNYCGARFSKKSSNCPKCGASKPD